MGLSARAAVGVRTAIRDRTTSSGPIQASIRRRMGSAESEAAGFTGSSGERRLCRCAGQSGDTVGRARRADEAERRGRTGGHAAVIGLVGDARRAAAGGVTAAPDL